MAYNQVTLAALITQIQTILDDPSGSFFVTAEVQYAIYEALRVFGALTGNWRQRGIITISPSTTWYDLSVLLPSLRSRSWTLNQSSRCNICFWKTPAALLVLGCLVSYP